MGIWWLIAWAAIAVLGSFFRTSTGKAAGTSAPVAETEVDVPTATEGRPIPVLFGTRYIEDGNVVWYGDLRTVAIRSSGGSGGGKK
jgi:hypothetical protein